MSATMTDTAPIADVLAETGWAYYEDGLHYAFRFKDNGDIIEHKATTEAELLRRVWRYEDWKGL